MKITHNKLNITNPPTAPAMAPIFVIRLDKECIAEFVAIVFTDGVGKGGKGTFGVPSGGKGNRSVNSVVEIVAVGEYGKPADEAKEEEMGGTFIDSSGG